jgi:hypothetical protein
MAYSVTDVKATSKEERRSVAVVGNRSPGLKPSGFAPNRRGNQIEQPAANALATPRGKGVKRDCSEIRGENSSNGTRSPNRSQDSSITSKR